MVSQKMKNLREAMKAAREEARASVKGIVYPVPDLKGPQGNAFNLLSQAEDLMKNAGIPDETRMVFANEARSEDYDHLLRTISEWFTLARPVVTYEPMEDLEEYLSERKAHLAKDNIDWAAEDELIAQEKSEREANWDQHPVAQDANGTQVFSKDGELVYKDGSAVDGSNVYKVSDDGKSIVAPDGTEIASVDGGGRLVQHDDGGFGYTDQPEEQA